MTVNDSARSDIMLSLSTLFRELLDGADPVTAWVLNPEDHGLLRSLDKLSAAEASAVPAAGGSSIAAHVDHLRYGLELLNRWSRGENPFADADYSASWRRVAVNDAEWAQLRARFRVEARRWHEAIRQPRALTTDELNGVIGSVVHLAYHLGAIRQIDRSTRGPAARD
jgi:DinB superfamily